MALSKRNPWKASAAQCSVSASTDKTHLENILRKVGVTSRTQAIAQARTLELVQGWEGLIRADAGQCAVG
jgi:hypothetical protein